MIQDVHLSEDIEQGAKGGPTFQTSLVGMSSGTEQANEDWEQSKLAWNISYGVSSQDQLYDILEFFNARRGSSRGFLFKDFSDYRATLVLLGTGDGSNKTFLFYKSYEPSGPDPYVRRITRPVASTIRIYVDGVLQTLTTHYTVGTGGWVQFVTAPGNGLAVRASFDFDVPVRFADDNLDLTLIWDGAQGGDGNLGAGSVDPIVVREVRDRENDIDTVCSITLTNENNALHDDTDTTSHVRVADFVMVDPLPTGEAYLSGADASYFEISGTSVYLRAGTALDSGVKASYAYTINLRDPQLAVDPADSDSTTVTVDGDSEDEVNLAITILVANEPNGTSSASAIHVADLVVTGGHTGHNGLALSGADAASFHLTGTQLFLNAGVDGGTLTAPPSSYMVTVTVTDSITSNTDSVTYTLTVGNSVTPGTTTLTADGTYIVPNYNTLTMTFYGAGAGSAGTNRAGEDGTETAILSLGLTAGGGKAPPNFRTVGSSTFVNTIGGDPGVATGGDTNTNGKVGANGGVFDLGSTFTTADTRKAGDGAGGPDTAVGGVGATITSPPYPASSGSYPVYEDGTDGADLGEGAGGSASSLTVLGIASGYHVNVVLRPGGGGGAKLVKTYVAGQPGSPAVGAHLSVFVGIGGVGGGDFANGGDGYRGEAQFTVA